MRGTHSRPARATWLEPSTGFSLEIVEHAMHAGISTTVDGRPGTPIYTHPEVQAVDHSPYDTGDGPCIDSFRSGQPVIIEPTAEAGPYPDIRRVAADHGLWSAGSVPMPPARTRSGR